MSHPFFDAAAFPWPHPQATAFFDALVEGIDDPKAILVLFDLAGGDRGGFNPNQPPRALWHDALDALTTQGRLRALCDALLKEPRPRVHAEVRRLEATVAPPQRLVLRGDGAAVFLDRADLRVRLEALASAKHLVKVLVVHGPEGSGRTWTRHLITEVAAETSPGDVTLYYCAGIFGDVHELIQDLFDRVGAPDLRPATPDTTTEAWLRRVCSLLLLAAQRQGRRYWIVLDDLDHDPGGAPWHDPLVRSLFDQFALLMVNDPYRAHFRLVLLAWPDEKGSTRWKADHWRLERTRADAVDAGHVGAYLGAWAGTRGEQMTDEQRARIAERVLAEAAAAPAEARLKTLHDALLRETGQGD